MALHSTPEAHEADPPAKWTVVKVADRTWHLDSSLGWTIGYYTTRKAAEADRESGPYVSLYEREGRWFAGQTPAGWRPWADVKAERDRREFRNSDGYRASVAQLTGELAGFGQYPPEENSRDGKCSACGCPVQAHRGLVVLGSDGKGTFAAHLHRGCAADVRRAQESAKASVS